MARTEGDMRAWFDSMREAVLADPVVRDAWAKGRRCDLVLVSVTDDGEGDIQAFVQTNFGDDGARVANVCAWPIKLWALGVPPTAHGEVAIG